MATFLTCLYRRETRQTCFLAVLALLSTLSRKNSWTLAEEAGLDGPQRIQRLCRTACGDWCEIRKRSLRYARDLLAEPSGILVVDETGFLKAGDHSAGVQRQYTGTAGKTENCQVGVFVSYQSSRGRCLIHQRLYMPRKWMNDPERCRKVHLPEDVRMQTKPAMAADMLDEIRSEGISAEWVAGDEVYGGNPTFRKRLIEAGQKFVLTIKSTERMWTRQPEMTVRRLRSGRIERKPYALGPQLRSAKDTVSAFAPRRWWRLKVDEGSKGPRVYDWAAKRVVHCEANEQPGYSFWLLARRSTKKPDEIAYYLCHAPAKTALLTLARVASARWGVEESIKDGKQEVGLDDYQVRSWVGWHRWMQLCTLALLWLTSLKTSSDVLRIEALEVSAGMTWSIAEIRRLFLIEMQLPPLSVEFRRRWARWRASHNLKARVSHYKRRGFTFQAGFP